MSYSRRRKVRKGMTALALVLGVAAMVALTASVTSAGKPPKPQPPPAAYSVTDLGPGSAYAIYAINDFGDVAGAFLYNAKSHAAILALSSVPKAIDLGTLGDATSSSRARGMNDLRQVVGDWWSPSGGYASHAFSVTPETDAAGKLVWYRDASGDGVNDLMVDLDPLAGLYPVTDSVARAINYQGQVVGYADGYDENFATLWSGAVLWQLDENGDVLGWVGLPGLDGAESWDAYDINSDLDGDGLVQVVGSAYSSDGLSHPVLWEVDADGYVSAPIDLGYLSAEDNTGDAFGINDVGQVVGISWSVGVSSERSFLVTPVTDEAGKPVWYLDGDNDGVNDLMVALVVGEGRAGAMAINDRAQVVGYASFKPPTKMAAFLWEKGVATPLINLIPSEPKWTLSTAQGINEARQIVGNGVTALGSHGYLLTPTK
jgi:uncharacterized membrane protein